MGGRRKEPKYYAKKGIKIIIKGADDLVGSFTKCVDVLLGLTGCSIQTRILLLIFCVHSKILHLLRGIPPSEGLRSAREIDEVMRMAVATVTYTDPSLLSAEHNNKALTQLGCAARGGGALI
eukprot:scaffold4745_cov125-Isochrysis_galbana.AAC.1